VESNDWQKRVWRGRGASFARAVLPTGFHELDSYLPGGGWPLGAITEIFVDGYGIGELALLMPALAALTKPDPAKPPKWVAWIAPPFVPYAPALQQHGVNTDRLLMIHPTSGHKNRLWAIEQVVRSGSSAGVLAWVVTADAGRDARGRATQGAVAEDVILRRLQLAAEDQGAWVLLFRPASANRQRSPAALRLRVSQAQATTRVEILKCRGGRPGVIDIASLGNNSLRSSTAGIPARVALSAGPDSDDSSAGAFG
jgi:cell division inhibitor SulA/protein ImuA